MRRHLGVVLALGALFAGCSESDDDPAGGTVAPTEAPPATDTPDDDPPTTAATAAADDDAADPVVEIYAGEPWAFGVIPDAPVAADPDVDPVVIGMVNQENTPFGSFPEMREAAQAAVGWINAELGGVGGRPIRLETCITSFSVEQSTACAQEMVGHEVVALVGGIDVTSEGSFPVFERNGIPQLGGVPVNLREQQSPVAFFFSGGTAGGMAAFMDHAAEQGAETVLIAHGDFPSFNVAARDYAAVVGESLGLDVELVSFPITSSDFLPVLNRTEQTEVDALVVLTGDTGCVSVMQLFAELGLAETSQLYLTGACASDEVTEAVGDDNRGVIFNSEGPEDSPVEGPLFLDVIDRYAAGPSGGAGTVAFRGLMNLWDVMVEIGPDDVATETILERLRAAEGRSSFWGHPYTCDGEQVPGLPSLCAPQQTLMTITDGRPDPFGEWIDTVELFEVVDP